MANILFNVGGNTCLVKNSRPIAAGCLSTTHVASLNLSKATSLLEYFADAL